MIYELYEKNDPNLDPFQFFELEHQSYATGDNNELTEKLQLKIILK